uniref:CCHC-type domain-containing protein n=1 Tax=Fagus sylvatica TaxID=28930 RepID=A0A2N9J970_FAGSY
MRLSDFCYGCGRLEHMKRDCKWGKERQEGVVAMDKFFKGYGPWLIAESITRKSNKAYDLMFLDVKQAHEAEKLGTKEGTSSMVEGKGREYLSQVENEHVEQLVSLPEADMFLHKVISNTVTDETSINEQSHMQEFAQVVGDEKIAVCETSQRVLELNPLMSQHLMTWIKTLALDILSISLLSALLRESHGVSHCGQSDSTSPLFFPLSLWIFLVALLKK